MAGAAPGGPISDICIRLQHDREQMPESKGPLANGADHLQREGIGERVLLQPVEAA